MKKQMAGIVLVSAMGVGAVSTVALAPAYAATAQESASKRFTEIRNALKGLVSDGTLTAAEADKVATALDKALPQHHGPGRHGGGHLEDAAKVLGMTVEQLRTALGTDKSLAQVAAAKGVTKADLISKMVAAAEARLSAAVKAGTITQAQADAKKAGLKEHITEAVDRVGAMKGRGGHGGRGHGGPPPAGTTAPSTTPSSTST
jgi:hypothetical protein